MHQEEGNERFMDGRKRDASRFAGLRKAAIARPRNRFDKLQPRPAAVPGRQSAGPFGPAPHRCRMAAGRQGTSSVYPWATSEAFTRSTAAASVSAASLLARLAAS